MTRRTKIALWCSVLLAVGLTLAGRAGVALAQEATDPRLEKILADWQKRQERMQRVRYRVEGVRVIPKGALSAAVSGSQSGEPPADVQCPISRMVLLDFAGNRYRLEIEEQEMDVKTQKLTPRPTKQAFNGTELYGHSERRPVEGRMPEGVWPDVGIGTGNMKVASFEGRLAPLFAGHGVVIVSPTDLIYPGHMRIRPDKNWLYIHDDKAVHADRLCTVLRTQVYPNSVPSFYREYWVDAERESAIVRLSECANGVPLVDMDIKYQETPQGWLPHSWTFTMRANAKQLILYDQMTVKELTPEPVVTDADFRLEVKPGMLVGKVFHPEPTADDPHGLKTGRGEEKLFRIGSNGSWNEVQIVNGMEVRPWWVLAFWWLTPLIAAIGIGTWLFFRRRSSQSGRAA
jgi:hypothetical protein